MRTTRIRHTGRPLPLRSLALLLALAATSLVPVSAAAAATPLHQRFDVDETFYGPFFSERCGIPVYFHEQGTVDVKLFYDQSGDQVVREIDTFPSFTETVFSPVADGGTGKSLTYPHAAMLEFDYTAGTAIGSPVTVTSSGLQGFAAPGLPGAGREIYTGVIVDISPEGIPLVEWPLSVISSTGTFGKVADPIATKCAYLIDP